MIFKIFTLNFIIEKLIFLFTIVKNTSKSVQENSHNQNPAKFSSSPLSTESSWLPPQASAYIHDFDSNSTCSSSKKSTSKRKIASTKKTNHYKKPKSQSSKSAKASTPRVKNKANSSDEFESSDEVSTDESITDESLVLSKKNLKNTDLIQISAKTQDLYTTETVYDISTELKRFNIKKCCVKIKRLDPKHIGPTFIKQSVGADDMASVCGSDTSSRSSHRRVRKSTGGRMIKHKMAQTSRKAAQTTVKTELIEQDEETTDKKRPDTEAKSHSEKASSSFLKKTKELFVTDDTSWDSADQLPDFMDMSNESEKNKLTEEVNKQSFSSLSLNLQKNQINS